MIFRDELLQQGEEGGRKAAYDLSFAVEDYVTANFPSIISPKIVTKMFVNMRALCDACVRAGVTTDSSIPEEFARGFNSSFPLFDLMDVGSAPNAAHDKIKGMQCTCRVPFYRSGLECRADRLPRLFGRDLQITFIQLPLSPDLFGLLRRITISSNPGRDSGGHGAFRTGLID